MRREQGQIFTSAVVLIVVGLVLTAAFTIPWYTRYQKRANANNNVKVSNIEIRNQKQRVQIAKQKAEIRRQDAIGIREAQDQIAKTLTPLYVQFEMTEALKAIATSGSNNSTVFIPAGAAGIPLVSTTDANKVTRP
jgi:hypothetical protein